MGLDRRIEQLRLDGDVANEVRWTFEMLSAREGDVLAEECIESCLKTRGVLPVRLINAAKDFLMVSAYHI